MMLDRRIDKVGIVVVLVSACCWIAYTTGFGIRVQQLQYLGDNRTQVDEVLNLPHFCGWCFVVSGVLLYLTTFVHLLCGWNVCSTISLTFLFPVHFVCGGGVLNLDGIALYNYITRGNVEISYDDYLPVEFCGVLGAMVFTWIFLFLWIITLHCQATSKQRQYETINS